MSMNVDEFLSNLRGSGSRPLLQPEVLRRLLETAIRRGMMDEVRKAAFEAKFIVKTRDVIGRIGSDGTGIDALRHEFEAAIGRLTGHVRNLTPLGSMEQQGELERTHVALDEASLSRFMELANDLALVKNWELDGKPLPDSIAATASPTSAAPDARSAFRRSVLTALLLILYIVIEPPVSILGIIAAVVIVVEVVFLVLHLYNAQRSL